MDIIDGLLDDLETRKFSRGEDRCNINRLEAVFRSNAFDCQLYNQVDHRTEAAIASLSPTGSGSPKHANTVSVCEPEQRQARNTDHQLGILRSPDFFNHISDPFHHGARKRILV